MSAVSDDAKPKVGDSVDLAGVKARVVSCDGDDCDIEIIRVNGTDLPEEAAEDEDEDDEGGEGMMKKGGPGAILLMMAKKQDKANGLA